MKREELLEYLTKQDIEFSFGYDPYDAPLFICSNENFKEFFNIENANISIRNFPESVAFLRKKLRIKDGGDLFLFFTTTEGNKKIILSCTKV